MMDDRLQHLATSVDGNALAGVLSGVFAIDVTTVVLTCGGCGLAEPLAEAIVERDAVCAIVRCRGCTRTQFTVLEEPDGLRIEWGSLAGMRLPTS